jgi:hypothetical protein
VSAAAESETFHKTESEILCEAMARDAMEADARRKAELEEEHKQQRWAATSNLIDGILLFDRHKPGDGAEMAAAYDHIRNAIAFLDEVASAMEQKFGELVRLV